MEQLPKNQVSLRGASVKEITRDALLEKVFQERELRQYARRAAAAALFVQRVWRRYKVTRTVALQLQEEWENLVNNNHTVLMKGAFISSDFLRPFLFFFKCLSTPSQKIRTRDIDCAKNCFKILLESISSTESKNNFCSLVIGTPEERRLWTYQARKLVSLCLSILSQFDRSHAAGQEIVALTSLGMRVVVVLTDSKGWKNITESSRQDADVAVKDLVQFLGTSECGLYLSIRRYMSKLDVPLSSQNNSIIKTDEKFVITASGITLALRPFYATNFDLNCPATWEGQNAAEQYCLFLLTIPWLAQRLPALLLPALKHKSILRPCLWTLLVLKDKILLGISGLDQSTVGFGSKVVPPVGWTLANIICLVTGSDKNSVDIGWFKQDSDYALYVRVSLILAENLLVLIEDAGLGRKENQDIQVDVETSSEYTDGIVPEGKNAYGSLRTSYIELLKPVCQQSHLTNLLTIVNTDASSDSGSSSSSNMEYLGKLGMLDIAYFYSFMLRIFSRLNPLVGSSPILNVLSFTPGFLTNLWGALEGSLFRGDSQDPSSMMMSGLQKDVVLERKKKKTNKDGANKWATMLHKLTSKQQEGYTLVDTADDAPPNHCQIDKSSSDVWDVESVRHGPQGISKDISCLLYLFSATYSHLLLVLDDIEFYEKQIPFTLEQQRRIASMLNTLVYNGLSHGTGLQNRSLMESAIRCLHLMYERDCRHRFCPPALWLSPARKSRPPVAVAARTHEVLSSTLRSDDVSTLPTLGSVITTTAHIFPFEERVEMFREFVKMDKVSRKMSGEDAGPGSRPVEISIRRSHIVEDGFRQLNSLGSKLKSSIHVTFVSECGLPEAGLDCGGLSKELLTDIAKAAFGPEYGLFSQTSTLDRLLIPNASARCIENGIHMIEFLGRVVGKALYEGILLEYSFSHVFVQKLLGRYSFLDELSTLDPELYRNLMYVKHYDGDVKDLSLDFTVTEDSFGKRHVIELKHGGKDVSVTNENKLQYVHAMADYKLNRQILPYSNAFYRGLTDLISPSWLKLFNASEFNQLLSGGNHDIDVDDLRNNTKYTGGYTEGSRTVKLFWEVMKSFEAKDRCMVLKFVTSCSRGPLLGFKHLQPNFTIHKIICDVPIWASIGGQDVERLPSASTCYNTLKLPTYKRSSTLREKLLYAINSNAGFELS